MNDNVRTEVIKQLREAADRLENDAEGNNDAQTTLAADPGFDGVSDAHAERIFATIRQLPAEKVTTTMVEPFVDFAAAQAMGKLAKHDELTREGRGVNTDPHKYELTDAGREWLDQYEADD